MARYFRTALAFIVVLLIPFAYSCSRSTTADESADAAKAEANLVGGNTEFALDLYHQLRIQEGNLFLSPYSISSALA